MTELRSIFDYPEHLNPFYEKDNLKRLRFWKVEKNNENENFSSTRRKSFTFGSLKSLLPLKSFRLSKKSSALGIYKTSESPPPLRKAEWNYNLEEPNKYTTYDPHFKTSIQQPFANRNSYSVSDLGFENRNNVYRKTVQMGALRKNAYDPSNYRYRTSESLRSSLSSINTNPFEENESVKKHSRKKRQAPLPPIKKDLSKNEEPKNESSQNENLNNQEFCRLTAELTAEFESFVNEVFPHTENVSKTDVKNETKLIIEEDNKQKEEFAREETPDYIPVTVREKFHLRIEEPGDGFSKSNFKTFSQKETEKKVESLDDSNLNSKSAVFSDGVDENNSKTDFSCLTSSPTIPKQSDSNKEANSHQSDFKTSKNQNFPEVATEKYDTETCINNSNSEQDCSEVSSSKYDSGFEHSSCTDTSKSEQNDLELNPSKHHTKSEDTSCSNISNSEFTNGRSNSVQKLNDVIILTDSLKEYKNEFENSSPENSSVALISRDSDSNLNYIPQEKEELKTFRKKEHHDLLPQPVLREKTPIPKAVSETQTSFIRRNFIATESFPKRDNNGMKFIRNDEKIPPTPPPRRRSIKDVIESINRNQKLLKVNYEVQPTRCYEYSTKKELNISNIDKFHQQQAESEKKINEILEDLQKYTKEVPAENHH